MSTFFKQRRIARESLDTDLLPNSVNLELPEDNLETQLGELPVLETELDEIDAAADVVEADIERAEGHVEIADDAVEQGEELDEATVAEIEVAQESMRKRYGIHTSRVARESFRSGSRGNTVVARESWRDTLKEIWQRFLDLLKAARNKIMEVKLNYFNAGKSAVKRSKKYRELMKKLGTEKAKEEISGAFLSLLSIERKFDMENSVAVARAMGGKLSGVISAYGAQVAKVTDSISVDAEGALTDTMKDRGVDLGGVLSKMSTLPGLEAEGSKYKVVAFPGDIYVQEGETGPEGSKYTVINMISGGEKPEESDIPTPTHAKINEAISGLSAVGTGFEKLLKDFEAYDRQMGKLESAVEKLVNQFDKATEDEQREVLSAKRSAADAELKKYKVTNRLARQVNTNVIKGLDSYIKTAMGAYKKAKK